MNHSRNKIYYEYLAKLVLERFFQETFCDLILSDRPDLVNGHGHGIEVTQAMFQNAGETEGLFRMLKKKSLNEVSESVINAFEKRGNKIITINGTILGYVPPVQWFSLSEAKMCFQEKLEKIKNYRQAQSVDLFIYAPMFNYYEKTELDEFCGWCAEKQKDAEKRFDCVFVFDYTKIFRCRLDDQSTEERLCDEQLIHLCCEQALVFAEKRDDNS